MMIRRNKRFVIPFEGNQASFAIHVSRTFDAHTVARALGFSDPRPTIYITGGASAMSPEDIAATRNIIERGLVRFAEDRQAVVIDGGTDAGLGTLLGDARRKLRGRFPLIGIAPLEKVHFPGYENPEESYPLNPGHSHFVLTGGDDFGDESAMITHMTSALSGDGRMPALGVLINGGKISRSEVHARTTSKEHSFPLVVIEGTGRFADILASAFYAGRTEEPDLQAIIASGRVLMVSITDGPDQLWLKLDALFRAHKPLAAAAR
jgi:hypothetical protein